MDHDDNAEDGMDLDGDFDKGSDDERVGTSSNAAQTQEKKKKTATETYTKVLCCFFRI